MNVVGKVSSFITQGVYSVATPFHPFGGAVDIIIVEQHDRTFRSTPWYVRFGKFQGVLKGAEKVVRVEVNGVEANFYMYLDNSGEAYFVREIDQGKDDCEDFKKESDNIVDEREDNSTGHSNIDSCSKENDCLAQDTNGYSNDEVELQDEQATLGMDLLERVESDANRMCYELQDEKSSLEDSLELSEYDSCAYSNLDSEHALKSQNSNSEVVLVSVDGHVLTAPISSSERKAENKELNTPQFHLCPSEGTEKYNIVEDTLTTDSLSGLDVTADEVTNENICKGNDETLSSELHLEPCGGEGKHLYHRHKTQVSADQDKEFCIDCNFDDIVNSFQSHEVFKGCLELQKLAVQSPTDDQEKVASSMKILEAADDLKENHHLSPSVNKAEDGNLEMSRDNDKLPRDNSENPISVSSTQVEAATPERNISDMDIEGTDNMPVQYTSSNHGALKQVEVKPTVRKMHSREESPVLNEYDENEHAESHICASVKDFNSDIFKKLEISLCGNLLHAGMGLRAAQAAFDANRISAEEFKLSAMSIVKNENLIIRLKGQYIPWDKAEHIILGMAACGLDLSVEPQDVIPVDQETQKTKEDDTAPSRGWSLWPIPFRRVKTLEQGSNNSLNEEVFADSDSASQSQHVVTTSTARAFTNSPRKKIIRTNVPTTDQIASLNLKEGQNMVNFIFSTRVLGSQKVEAHIYLWKWNARIVISDVDGTITKSDVLGQFMPLVGKDWTHSGIARLFCAIKENGYQLLFLSARAIVQSYLTKSFLFNLKQDGKSLPSGPVVISPDGLFPSLYREVIRRTPHEFKIACLEGIKALFPPDYNPFYAGFGNRDTDELSYRKIGIPKGKILIINPKGEVAINRQIDVKSYTSLHTLVNDMFPPTPLVEQEDYNSWNYWKMPLPEVDDL